MLEIADLEMVRAVGRHGSLTRAALHLHTTQSALSHRLTGIEERLGTQVFERLGRTMRPTPAGAKLILEAEAILQHLSRATADARAEGGKAVSVLRLATECYTCYSWLPPVLALYQRTHPRAAIEIILEATRRPVAALLEGQLDVGIVCQPVHDRRLSVEPLFKDELVAIMAPSHPSARFTCLGAEDFAKGPLIIHDYPLEQSSLFRKVLSPGKVMPTRVSRVPLTEAIIEMVKAGLGVGVLARWAVVPHLRAGTLCAKRITTSGLRRQWQVVTLRSGSKRPHQMQFVKLLRSQLCKRQQDQNRA
jgi:LysR family transcriptional regulator for metE and metH